MKFNWRKYRKLIPATLGTVLLVILNRWNIEIPGLDGIILSWLVSGATVFGVYQAKNEQ